MPRTTRPVIPPRARPVIPPRTLPARSPPPTARRRSMLTDSQLRASAPVPQTRVPPRRSARRGSAPRGVRPLCRATTRPANRVRSPVRPAAYCSSCRVTRRRPPSHHGVHTAQTQAALPPPLSSDLLRQTLILLGRRAPAAQTTHRRLRPLGTRPARHHPAFRTLALRRRPAHRSPVLRQWTRPRTVGLHLARPVAPGGGSPVQKRGQNRDSNGGTGG